MTARRKETGEMELIPGMGTKSFRVALLMLVISMHPLGRQILGTVGFKFPDEQKLVVATEKAADTSKDTQQLKEDVKDLKDAILRITASSLIINTKLDDVGKTIGGFKIDLDDLRKHITIDTTKPSP